MTKAAQVQDSAKHDKTPPVRQPESGGLQSDNQGPVGGPALPLADPLSITSPDQVLALQRTVGNHAVRRLLSAKRPPAIKPPAPSLGASFLPEQYAPNISASTSPNIAVQRSLPAPVIQRQIGKGQDGADVIRLSDGAKFWITNSTNEDDIEYYDLVSIDGGDDVEHVAENDPDYKLASEITPLDVPEKKQVKEKAAPSKYAKLDDRPEYGGPPESDEGKKMQRLFVKYIDNCVIAGLSEERVVEEATYVLRKWHGWDGGSDPEITVLPYFKQKLMEEIKGATADLLDACFTESPNIDELLRFASEKLPAEEKEEEFNPPEGEDEFVDSVTKWFVGRETDSKLVALLPAGLKKLWKTSSPDQKHLIHSLMSPVAGLRRLSELDYLLEAIDIPKHRFALESGLGKFSSWAKLNSNESFLHWLNSTSKGEGEKHITYYTEEQRAAFELKVGSTIKTADDQPLKGDNIFVMSAGNIFYGGSKSQGQVNVHHSSFLAGQAVASAGHLITNQGGRLETINLASGHYKPLVSHLAKALVVLQQRGMDLSTVIAVPGEAGTGVPADAWLSNYLASKDNPEEETDEF